VGEEARNRGIRTRITVWDGSPQILTEDFVPNRVGLIVENNIVTGIEMG
jgi:hypothetical protein